MLRVSCPSTHLDQRRYVLDIVLRRWLGHDFTVVGSAEGDDTVIELNGSAGRILVADHVLQLDRPERLDDLERSGTVAAGIVGEIIGAESVPVLWGSGVDVAVRSVPESGDLRVDIDVFGTAFALLTGLSELTVSERDVHGRVPMAATPLGRCDLVSRPVVDEQVAVLQAAMTMLWPNVSHRGRVPASVPTHDVDRLSRYGTTPATAPFAVLGALRSGGVKGAVGAARAAFDVHARGERDPYFTFDRIMDLSEECGATSNFYFIPRYRRSDGTPPSRYTMTDQPVIELLHTIDRRGHYIGIHPGYDSFRDTAALVADVAELRAATERAGATVTSVGGRHHYLRWDPERSPACWAEAGLAHDSSFGFAERPGFRAGTSRPYPLWDHVNSRPTDVEERPLIWMDASIFADDPAGLTSETVMADAMELRRRCHRHGGDFTFLVHNDGFAAPGGEVAYRTLLTG